MMRFNFFKKQKEEPVKVLELFGGIGACTQAFKRVGIPFEVVDYVEIDKYACKSYNAINGTDFKPQDICEWDKDIKVDFIMHGSPCQDFSVAGKGLGGDEGSGTRSSLMYETIRIVEKLKPKYVLWENVKNVTGKKHRHNYSNHRLKEDWGSRDGFANICPTLDTRCDCLGVVVPYRREQMVVVDE